MRTTRASAAIDRLKRRSGNPNYSMIMTRNGLFSLGLAVPIALDETSETASQSAMNVNRLCEPMPMEEFVLFVNAYGPQTPKRVSQLEVAFNEQLARSKANKG